MEQPNMAKKQIEHGYPYVAVTWYDHWATGTNDPKTVEQVIDDAVPVIRETGGYLVYENEDVVALAGTIEEDYTVTEINVLFKLGILSRSDTIDKECPVCGNLFTVIPARKAKAKYCCLGCKQVADGARFTQKAIEQDTTIPALDDLDRAYIAGLWEGEGTIEKRGRHLNIVSTDKDVIEWLYDVHGETGSIYETQPKVPNSKLQFRWCLNKQNDIIEWCRQIKPYLKMQRRKDQIDSALGVIHKTRMKRLIINRSDKK